MSDSYQETMNSLTLVQGQAVNWNNGSLVVIAGPGSGKTRVLTCRIARILHESQRDSFRILALTFTNKAATEMMSRVAHLVPELQDRTTIGTFHSFSSSVLRQHGYHLGVNPDFVIYSQRSDRLAVLEDALRRGRFAHPHSFSEQALPLIDRLKSRLVDVDMANSHIRDLNGLDRRSIDQFTLAYRLYEEELRRINALDFNSLIFYTHKLFSTYPAFCEHYQLVYPHWLIDEFQDTNFAQYEMLRSMAGPRFQGIFAVADDDQTIFEWNGADVRRIQAFVQEFRCKVLQLPTNFRCPSSIVEVANRLIAYNAHRLDQKEPATSSRKDAETDSRIESVVFDTEHEEAIGVAKMIARHGASYLGNILVLARNKGLLLGVLDELNSRRIRAAILARKNDFDSAQIRWLLASLKQLNRPLDRRNMAVVTDTFNSFSSCNIDSEDIYFGSEFERINYIVEWARCVRDMLTSSPFVEVVDLVIRLSSGQIGLSECVQKVLTYFESNDYETVKSDVSAWRRIESEINDSTALNSLDRYLQALELQSKEPVLEEGTVRLMTIHSAKGLECETVYLMGLAEDVLPSWHSVKKGDTSTAMEEERRECFVAVTRTREHLVLSRARFYRGWRKRPSRFLAEMGFK